MNELFLMGVKTIVFCMWVILTGFAIYMALHYKETPTEETVGRFSVWLYYYALVMIALVTLAVPIIIAVSAF